jgi:hypothetical protein
MTRWEKSKCFQELESLLHVGFDVTTESNYGETKYEPEDRIIFYLSVADGWALGDKFFTMQESCFKRRSELRQKLAFKAFNVLCLNFFKFDKGDNESNFFWRNLIATERLLVAISNFFRAEKNIFGEIGIRNLSLTYNDHSHNEQQAVLFLSAMAKFIFELEKPCYFEPLTTPENIEENKKISEKVEAVDSLKPWLVEVLVCLNKADILRRRIVELNDACISKLEEIAFRAKIHCFTKIRPVETLEEAFFANSLAAYLLVEYRIKRAEHERLKESW